MTRSIIISFITTLLCIYCLLPARAQLSREYTEERPLIVVSDWEFPPYEFRNDQGEPDGYNVEVLRLILNKLKIPHKFVMQEWAQATKTFENHEADLIHALAAMYRKRPYVMTQNMITYYPIKSVRRKSQEPLAKISQLGPEDTLMVKNNDYATLRIQQDYGAGVNLEYRSPKDALTSIRNGKDSYYLWGAIPLKMKIKEYGLDSLVLDDTDIPPGELRIIGYDKELIESIDDIYARLEQSGDLQAIYDKWYYPERVHNDSSPVALFVILGAFVVIIIIFLLSRLIRSRVAAAISRTEDINSMMSQALKMGSLYVIEYDIAAKHYYNVYGDLLPGDGLSDSELLARFPPDYQSIFKHKFNEIVEEGVEMKTANWRLNLGTVAEPEWHYLQGNAAIEKEGGTPRFVVYSLKDITRQLEEELLNSETGNKYLRMFETNLIAMSFYSKEGKLLDVNEVMRQLCEFDSYGGDYFRSVDMFDVPAIKGDYERGSKESIHVCQHLLHPDKGIDKYIELRVRPALDDYGELQFYIVTGRDVTAERDQYIKQRRHDHELLHANNVINMHEKRLNYLLENSQMFIWRSDFRNGTISFSHSMRYQEHTETLKEYSANMYPEDRISSENALADAESMSKPFNTIHHFHHTFSSSTPVWLDISGMPTYEKNGERIGYFGVARDITKLMVAQQKLKLETERAENSGKMKSAFLANMTHEIRTPLNAIVGFSDLLPVVDTPEERMEFIRIIRNNCDMLMRLINDILAASNMEQALTIEPAEVDFAKVFDDICQSLAQRVQEGGVEFIKDNPYEHCLTSLDKGRVQQVLTNFTTNAVKYTKQGFIKVGYHWDRRMTKDGRGETDGLVFYCLDTGAGIPKEKQASVFERFVKLNDFVQGTGLGLSICQAIADRCNGHIGVTSEGEGKGSTFWMWIPCEKK